MIRFLRNLPLAAVLMVGILAFSYGASRMLTGPVAQVAAAIQRGPVQVVTVDP